MNDFSVTCETGHLRNLHPQRMAGLTGGDAATGAYGGCPLMGCTGCFTQQVRLGLFHLQIGEVAWRTVRLMS